MEKLSDEYIMEKIKFGNLDYLATLFDRYNNQILNYFFRMTGSIEDSKDLSQTLFLRIIIYKKSFKQNKVFKYWMFQIAKNLLTNYYKTLQKHSIDFEKYIPKNINNNEKDNQHEEDKLLFDAISKLPDKYKELIILSKFARFKYKEIAEIFLTTEASIKNNLYRALDKLREIYFETK